jgi:hypothetical protein
MTAREYSIFQKGYKGKGMCSHCTWSEHYPQPDLKNQLFCYWYASSCKKVSRNCLGIKLVKQDK